MEPWRRVLAHTTMSFDISVLELLMPLTLGACVALAPDGATRDGRRLRELAERCDLLQSTPSGLRLLLAAGWRPRPGQRLLCGGEAVTRDLCDQLLADPAVELWNVYGPTETTIWSTCSRVTDPNEIHIGRPIANTQIRIVDAGLQPVPIGVAGELLIGGDGLARGYANRPELTAEKFVDLPGEAGRRFYRTGDLARYRSDGNIDCLGRLDFQVKVRGFRVELGEIEAVLLQHDALINAVVVATSDGSGEAALVAYCVPRPNSTADGDALRRHLELKLPEYMIPALFMFMPALPTTPNGKIDRRALPEPQFASAAEPDVYRAPTTPTEGMLCEVFADVLHVKQIGVNDDFFRLGGRSLEAVRAVSRIRQAMGVEIPVALLFEHSSVASLAQRLVMMQAGELGDAELAALLDDIEAGSHE
jgi:acyl-coenzyme A synthetase/AMP-(fatty) acid ligase